MRKVIYSSLFFFLVFLAGCSHQYTWKEYPITSERITSAANYTEGTQVHVISGNASDEKITLASVGIHTYHGTYKNISDGLVEQLKKEFENLGVVVNETADKSIEVKVDQALYEQGMWKIAATLKYTITLGNGNSKVKTVRNSSPTNISHTFNGVVALAVIDIINDEEVVSYLNK